VLTEEQLESILGMAFAEPLQVDQTWRGFAALKVVIEKG